MEDKNKFGPITRRVLEELPEERLVRLYILTTKMDLGGEERNQLKEAGGQIETGVGNLILVTCKAGKARQIADLNFVRGIELSEVVLLYAEDDVEDIAR